MKTKMLGLLALLIVASVTAQSAPFSVGGNNTQGASTAPDVPSRGSPKMAITTSNNLIFYIWALRGPVRDNTNAWEAWSAQVVEDIYDQGFPNGALSNRVTSTDVTQPMGAGNATNETLWFAFRAISTGNNIQANKFRFYGNSSDNLHYLQTYTDVSNPDTVWSPAFWGITWGGDMPRSNDTVRSSAGAGKISETPVREVIFIGAQLTYFMYGSAGESNAIHNYIWGFPNWRVNGTWVYGDTGATNSYASKSLDTKDGPFLPRISLSANASTKTVGVNGAQSGTSVVVRRQHHLVPGAWQVLFTGNHGDTFMAPSINHEFFDIQSQ